VPPRFFIVGPDGSIQAWQWPQMPFKGRLPLLLEIYERPKSADTVYLESLPDGFREYLDRDFPTLPEADQITIIHKLIENDYFLLLDYRTSIFTRIHI